MEEIEWLPPLLRENKTNQINSINLISFVFLGWPASGAKSFIESTKSSIHWFINSSIPFTFALFTSTFIPLYCYNTFLFVNSIQQWMKSTQEKKFISLIGWIEWMGWMELPQPQLHSINFIDWLRWVGYRFCLRLVTIQPSSFNLTLSLINQTTFICFFGCLVEGHRHNPLLLSLINPTKEGRKRERQQQLPSINQLKKGWLVELLFAAGGVD